MHPDIQSSTLDALSRTEQRLLTAIRDRDEPPRWKRNAGYLVAGAGAVALLAGMYLSLFRRSDPFLPAVLMLSGFYFMEFGGNIVQKHHYRKIIHHLLDQLTPNPFASAAPTTRKEDPSGGRSDDPSRCP